MSSACIGRPSPSRASTAWSTRARSTLEVFTVAVDVIRAPQATDELVLPAIVSPDLAARRRPRRHRSTCTSVAGHAPGPCRRSRPTSSRRSWRPEPRFAIVALDPWLIALIAVAVPGPGRPNEMWLATGRRSATAEVRAALASRSVPLPDHHRPGRPGGRTSRRPAEPGDRLGPRRGRPCRSHPLDRRARDPGRGDGPARRSWRAGRPRDPGRPAVGAAWPAPRPDRLAGDRRRGRRIGGRCSC